MLVHCYVCFGIIYGCFVLRRIHYKRTNNNIRKSFIIITLLLRVSYDCPGNHNKVKKHANLVRNIWDQRHWIKLLHAKVHTVLIVKIWETGTRQRWLAFWLHTCCYTLWKVLNFYLAHIDTQNCFKITRTLVARHFPSSLVGDSFQVRPSRYI